MVTSVQVNLGLFAILGAGSLALLLDPSLPMAALFIIVTGAYALWIRALHERGVV